MAGVGDRKLHVTLIHPPASSTLTARTLDAVPPLGLAYVAAAVVRAGYDVDVVDAVGERLEAFHIFSSERRILLRGLDFDTIVDRVPEHTDVIGISCMFSNAWRPVRALVERLAAARPEARIVLGGEHATACHEHILATCPAVDFCVLGEGEETFCRLLDQLAEQREPRGLRGVAARGDPDASVPLSHVPPSQRRPRVRDVGSIAEPAWELFPLEHYLAGGFTHGVSRGRTMPILASRGCPYQCTFCSSPNMWTTKWIARSPRDVLDEMKRYMVRYGARDFAFYDLTAIVARRWIVEFCKLILQEGIVITWQLPTGTRSEAIDEEVAALLYASGCRSMDYAPESGSPSVLRRIKKRVDPDRMMRSMRAAIAQGIQVRANIILGFPDETHREVAETYVFIAKLASLGLDSISVFGFCPYPGSEIFDDLVARGRIRLDDDFFDMMMTADSERTVSYNERFTARQLLGLWVGAQSLFYAVQLFAHPSRVARTALAVGRRENNSKLTAAWGTIRARRSAWRTLSRRAAGAAGSSR